LEDLIRLRTIFVFIISVFIYKSAFSQNLPDYKERSFSGGSIDTSIVANYATAVGDESVNPDEYIVGTGDNFFISISGLQDAIYTTRINQDGYLFIPKVGGVDLNNSTFTEAKGKITSAIDKYYKNVDVFISLVNIRKIRVSLLGDVKKPSTYTLPGNARLIDLIVKSYGLTTTSNYRNIDIKSNDGKDKIYDLLEFLRYGDKKNNPLLHEGDAVIVDKVDKVVNISGEVKYPGIYEYIPNETASDLIKLAGGLLSKARRDTIEIVRFDSEGKSQISKYYSYEDLQNKSIILNNQDMIIVRQIPQYYVDRFVLVKGWVRYPGYYKIIKNITTLEDIIKQAGGFLQEASLEDATVTRSQGTVEKDPEFDRLKTMQRKDMTDDEYDYFKAKSRQRKGVVVVDFVALFKDHNESENIILKRGDVIDVPEAKNYIIMLGQINNAGNIIYQKNLKVDDYIRLAGGFGWRAEKGDVRVIRANSGEWIEADKVDSLSPGDAIWVPENPPAPKFWDVFTTSLQVVGQLAAIIAATIAVVVATRK